MWTQVFICFTLFIHIKGDEIFDVTTIYEVGSLTSDGPAEVTGRVHARTNALGLPLIDGSGEVLSSQYPYPYNISFDPEKMECNWDKKNWMQAFSKSKLGITAGAAYKIPGTFNLMFINYQNYGYDNYLYFTSNSSNIRSQETKIPLLIRFFSYGGNLVDLYTDCNQKYSSRYSYQLTDRDGSSFNVYCTPKQSIPFTYSNGLLTFQFDNNKVKIYRGEKSPSLQFDSTISSIVNYYSMSGVYLSSVGPTVRQFPVLTASTEGSEMVSPVFSPEARQLCLTLVVYCEQYTSGDILQVSAEDLFHNEQLLKTVRCIKTGLNVQHVHATLQHNITSPIQLIITKVGSTKVNISRISSCSVEGEEVQLLPPVAVQPYNVSHLPVYKPKFSYEESVLLPLPTIIDCLNGGVWTSGGCSCPAGFSGDNCQSGCGRNHFGQDCKGLCSLHPQECRGLLLCTADTRCQCAPGYTGYECKTQCSPGWYGNNCLQPCGHCSPGQCDIYTGKCSGCEPGYHPPYCNKACVYYASKPELSSPDYGTLTVIFDPKNYITADGEPELYQIQYKEKSGNWRIHISKSISRSGDEERNISNSIKGLKTGNLYSVRVLLMDTNFNKYDGDLVQESEIITKCDIPESYDYKVTADSNSTSIKFSWTYVNDSQHWCPLQFFEVSWKEVWKWTTDTKYQSDFGSGEYTLTDFLPRSIIKFRVRAKSSGGFAPYSKILQVSTKPEGSSEVEDLRVVSSHTSSVELSWTSPRDSGDRQLHYTVTYKCVAQPACPPGCNNATEGQLTLADTSVTLSPLLPFAQYLVTVTPEDGSQSRIYVGTSKSLPMETPNASAQSLVRTNTSLTVFWAEVPVCSSFLLGYNYQLIKESDSLKVLSSGFTEGTSVTFHNLTASTDYIINVFVLTVAGWNPDSFLAIKTSTSATVPEAVLNLTLYKKGRSMLGLRWAEPRATYGKLKSFTVKHVLGREVTTHSIEPTRCIVWPDLYCHTIEALKSNKKYNISVSARNTDVAEDGEEAYITGVTKESPPSPPENLKLINSSSTSVGLQWRYPNLANGIVRSFVISVEETEQLDQDNCCQVYPLVEIAVTNEAQTYEAEVSGLHPASTYFVSVSAKTVGLSPPQSLVVYTRPPHLPLTALPQVQVYTSGDEVSWQSQQQLAQVNNSDIYSSLIKAHLLLALTNETQPQQQPGDSGILDTQLDTLLHQMITTPFFFVSEYSQEEEVDLSEISEDSESLWGRSSFLTSGQQYQLVAVQVTEYNGSYNADLRYSSTFIY